MENKDYPEWYDGSRVNEVAFCQEFLKQHPMVCVNDSFFTVDGRINNEAVLRKAIYDELRPWVITGLAKKTDNLISVLRSEAFLSELPVRTDRIHVANGTLYLNGTFSEEKEICRNRFPVHYNPDARYPAGWIVFLNQLLETEDIFTLQEFVGYCLVPTTRAQKMLMIIGRGGEGKSRIGVVMRSIFGCNMVNGNLAKVETNRFARADLEHALVMVDDDMQMEGLPETNYLKMIITADIPLDLERKSKQSYQGELYSRFMGFGNGSIKALYDRSNGFFRRQIILGAKRRDPERVDDPYLSEKLTADPEGIFLWCFHGLQRLLRQNYQFTISEKTKSNMAAAVSISNNVVDFMDSKGYLVYSEEAEASTKTLFAAYKLWCDDNAVKPLSATSFSRHLSENQDNYHIHETNKIVVNGKRVRGYYGIKPDASLHLAYDGWM